MKNEMFFKIFKKISKSVLVLTGMLFLFATQEVCVQAEGGTFYHKHTDACYETVEIPCTEHINHTETVNEMGECPFCGRTTYMYAFVNVETCPYTGESAYTYVTGVCQECGNIVYQIPIGTFPAHTREVTNLICEKTEETPIAHVSFSQSTIETTVDPVVLSTNIEVVDDEFLLSEVQYSFDGGNSWEKNASKAFSENGTYTIVCKDVYGTIFQETYTISCIVKPQPKPVPPIPIEEPKEQEVVEEEKETETETETETEKTMVSKKEPPKESLKTKSQTIPTKSLEFKEIIIPSCKPAELGISMEGINWSYAARKLNSYLQNANENQVVEMEPRAKEVDVKEEIRVIYRLAPAFVSGIYFVGCIFLFIAILGCIWYAYHGVVFLYEVENKERFFIGILIGTGKKERNVYISGKNMNKIGTKELLLTCFYYKQKKNMVVHTPLEKFRIKWEKEMHVNL